MTGCRDCFLIGISTNLAGVCVCSILGAGGICCLRDFIIVSGCRKGFFLGVSGNGVCIYDLSILGSGCFCPLCFFPSSVDFFLCRFCLCFGLSLCFGFRFWLFFCFRRGCLVICWWLCFCFGLCCT